MELIWMSGKYMTADVLTKNLSVNDFERHNSALVSDEEFGSHEGESVRE